MKRALLALGLALVLSSPAYAQLTFAGAGGEAGPTDEVQITDGAGTTARLKAPLDGVLEIAKGGSADWGRINFGCTNNANCIALRSRNSARAVDAVFSDGAGWTEVGGSQFAPYGESKYGALGDGQGVFRQANLAIRHLFGGTTNPVASATTLPAPQASSYHISGTTTITSISVTGFGPGVEIVLIFDGILTVTDGANLKLAGDFVTTADDTLHLVTDGTNWFEVGRSVN